MNEFAKAMHTLGLRLKRPEYKILFDEYDIDGNGTIDLPEFTHMVKKYLKLPCEENDCLPCHGSDGSNQPRAVYRKKWVDDETLLDPAAAVLQVEVDCSWILVECHCMHQTRIFVPHHDCNPSV